MNEIYLQLREESRKIVAELPVPKFYQHFAKEVNLSRQMLDSNPVLVRIKQEIRPLIEDDFGHGVLHSDLVCVDAGAIVQIEMQQNIEESQSELKGGKETKAFLNQSNHTNSIENLNSKIVNQIMLVQTAGLLHDIKRKEKEHSAAGAEFARQFLSSGSYPFTSDEIDIVCSAISEHEAFQGSSGGLRNHPPKRSLISNSLYDADKFRWGPDNFTHTVWDMVMFSNVPLAEFIRRYPAGMSSLEKIKNTFRTDTGKLYGPDFIVIGIETGNRLLKRIKALNIIKEQ